MTPVVITETGCTWAGWVMIHAPIELLIWKNRPNSTTRTAVSENFGLGDYFSSQTIMDGVGCGLISNHNAEWSLSPDLRHSWW